MAGDVLLLRREQIAEVLDMASCIEAVERAFVSASTGAAELPAVIHLDVPDHRGEIHVKAGYVHGGPHYATKFASWFGENLERATPPSDGLVCVFDAFSGSPAAFLLDRGYITDVRTGAAGGVAARHLAPVDVRCVGVIGTGTQARVQLDALAVTRPGFREVRVWGRDPDHARLCVEDLRARAGLPEDCRFDLAPTVEAAVRDAEVVITCTASTEPLVRTSWLAPGVHVTALGSDGIGKQELEAEVLRAADLLVVDSRDQCGRLGELQHAPQEAERAAELGEICAGLSDGRTSVHQRTVCDLTGVGVQDVAAATLVLERALAAGLGDRIAI